MNRRSLLTTLVVGGSTLIGGAFYTWRIEPYWVEYVRRSLPIANLPDSLVGKTLIQLSDLHVGNRFDWRYLIRAFQGVTELEPDIVVYTGDFVSYESEEQYEQLKQVMAHAPLGKLGSVAVLGNHDYGLGWRQSEVAQQIASIVFDAGIPVLRNAMGVVAGLNIIGIDDLWGTNFVPDPVMAQVQPDQPNLVLCHNPDAADLLVWGDYQGWILSGHTHGGQVKPPFLPPPMLPVRNKRYTAGVFDLHDGRMLYVNRALGCLWPVRFNMRPEVTVFTLVKG